MGIKISNSQCRGEDAFIWQVIHARIHYFLWMDISNLFKRNLFPCMQIRFHNWRIIFLGRKSFFFNTIFSDFKFLNYLYGKHFIQIFIIFRQWKLPSMVNSEYLHGFMFRLRKCIWYEFPSINNLHLKTELRFTENDCKNNIYFIQN